MTSCAECGKLGDAGRRQVGGVVSLEADCTVVLRTNKERVDLLMFSS